MQIEIATKQDIQSLKLIIADLTRSIRANERKGLGIVYTTRELAEKLKVSTKTINNWREARILEFAKVNNTILYSDKAVAEFLACHTIKRKSTIVDRLNFTHNG